MVVYESGLTRHGELSHEVLEHERLVEQLLIAGIHGETAGRSVLLLEQSGRVTEAVLVQTQDGFLRPAHRVNDVGLDAIRA